MEDSKFEYTWKLTGLQKKNNLALGLTNVIVQTYWDCIGTDKNGDSGKFIGATSFNLSEVDPERFVDFDQLTESQILGWIKDHIDQNLVLKQMIDERISEQIEMLKNPVVDVPPDQFPWIKNISEEPAPEERTDSE